MSWSGSRPARLGAELIHGHDGAAAALLSRKRVLISLERNDADSIDTFMLALNETMRICPNVGLVLPDSLDGRVRDECDELATGIVGSNHTLHRASLSAAAEYDAVLVVGETVRGMPGWIAVTSDGWIGRTASWVDDDGALTYGHAPSNPIGADVAASLGVARVFGHLFGRDPGRAVELSAHALTSGELGAYPSGPVIPTDLPELDALLIGCGSVMHGWAHTARRLPIIGRARAIDPQSIGPENIGTYVHARLADLGREKVDVLKDVLAPRISVTPDRDFVELFSRRLEGELVLPPLVVAGLDETAPRHVVQRWWPRELIDMATHGLTVQIVVKSMSDEGMCLLDALPTAAAENTALHRAATSTGIMRPLVAQDLLDPLDASDVAAAPVELRDAMDAARAAGTRRCSWILAADVGASGDASFSAAAPFVAGLAGTLAAGRTVVALLGDDRPLSVRMHASFASERAVVLESRPSADCECLAKRRDHGT